MYCDIFYIALLCYLVISYWILFASSLWTLYFGLELQWMFLIIFIIAGSSVWRGLLNYLILNGILSTLLIISLLLNNYVLFIFGLFGKVGFFPFFVLLSYQYCSSSYLWIFFDLINKWAYFGSIILSIYFDSLLSLSFSDWYVLINFLMIVFLIRFVLSMKHFILVSALQLLLFIIFVLYFNDELICFVYFISYLFTTVYIIWDCLCYTGGAYYAMYCNNIIINSINNYSNPSFHATSTWSYSFNWFFYYFYLFPYFFTDLTSIKELVKINSILYILYIFYCFSFFPSIMFLLKLFILFNFIISSIYFTLTLTTYITYIIQSFYLISLSIILSIV